MCYNIASQHEEHMRYLGKTAANAGKTAYLFNIVRNNSQALKHYKSAIPEEISESFITEFKKRYRIFDPEIHHFRNTEPTKTEISEATQFLDKIIQKSEYRDELEYLKNNPHLAIEFLIYQAWI